MTDTANKILIVAAMVNLLVGALSGIPMGLARQHGATALPKYLTMVHLGGLMHGPILITVAVALTISTAEPWVATLAAILLAGASLLLIAKDTLNWQQGVQDEFREHSLGLKLGQVFGPLHIIGLLIATGCVITGL